MVVCVCVCVRVRDPLIIFDLTNMISTRLLLLMLLLLLMVMTGDDDDDEEDDDDDYDNENEYCVPRYETLSRYTSTSLCLYVYVFPVSLFVSSSTVAATASDKCTQ